VATRVSNGETIARVRDAFGDTIREYQAPHDGVVIGKSSNPISPTGSRILHIGHEMDGAALSELANGGGPG
jgi:predicted deacylase